MNRYFHLVLITAGAFLMVIMLMLGVGSQTPVYSAGNTIKVPDDHGTIQAAVDAAVDGDTIMVESGHYKENLIITEGITLTGGWDELFISQTPGSSIIDGQGLGRVISITCVNSDTVVTVDGFTIKNGDATGLGMPVLAGFNPSDTHSESSGMPGENGAERSIFASGGTADLKVRLADLAARGSYPGGLDAYQNFLDKLDQITNRVSEIQSRSELKSAARPSAGGPDAGGGVFSHNASLHLLNSIVEWNVASMENDGYGGGIYVSQAPPSGTQILDNVIRYNTGSMYAEGRGGGVHLFQSPAALIEGNELLDNTGSSGGQNAVGGGLYLDQSPGVYVREDLIARNTAQAGSNCPDMFGGGVGGGAYIRFSDGAVIFDNIIQDNLAAVRCGSHTGGLYVYRSNDVQISTNQVTGNWSVLYQVYADDYGGGIGLDTLENAYLSGNTVYGNAVSINSPQDEFGRLGYGGGIYGYGLIDSQFTLNEFEENIASYQRLGNGGGVSIAGAENLNLGENNFTDNAGSLFSKGAGGGLHLLNSVNALVHHNRFVRNSGSVDGEGSGGGLQTDSWGPHSINTRVEANQFIQNQASQDPGVYSSGGASAIVTYGFKFTNNVVAGNKAMQGAGLRMDLMGEGETAEVTNNTFSANGETGILVGPGAATHFTFTNNIIVDHTLGISVTEGKTALVRYTLWDGNDTDYSGSGVISHTQPVSGDPAFVDPAAHDYRLTGASAAVDAGDPDGVPPAPPEDLDGLSRPQNERVDIGAYEWDGFDHIYLPPAPKDWKQQIGWAVGEVSPDTGRSFGTIIRTTDGGYNWVRQGTAEEIPEMSMNGVSAVDPNNTWVAGGILGDGVILRTTDGGSTWGEQEIPSGSDVEMLGVYAVDGDTAWAAGQEGVILHTNDGGATWNRQGEGDTPEVQLQGVYASDADNIWVVGDNISGELGTVMRTTDGGDNWNQITYELPRTPCQPQLIDVHGVDAETVWVVGPCQVSFTDDGGLTWIDQWKPDMEAEHFNGVYALDRSYVWLARDAGAIYLSADGGDNYIKQDAGVNDEIMRITAIDRQTAWAVTVQFFPPFDGNVLHTVDGGLTWITQTTPVATSWSWVSFVR